MTQQEAQIRNHKIMRLKGMTAMLPGLIPEDLYQYLPKDFKENISEYMNYLDNAMLCAKKPKAHSTDICNKCFDRFYSETHYLDHSVEENDYWNWCEHCSNTYKTRKYKRMKL